MTLQIMRGKKMGKARIALAAAFCVLSGPAMAGVGEDFETERIQTITGRTSDPLQTFVDLELTASSLPYGVKCVYRAPVENGRFSQVVKLFPGFNMVVGPHESWKWQKKWPYIMTHLYVDPPRLRIVLKWPWPNEWAWLKVNGWFDFTRGSGVADFSRVFASDGLYRISVHYQPSRWLSDNGENSGSGAADAPPATRVPVAGTVPLVAAEQPRAAVYIYVDDRLVYWDSIEPDALNDIEGAVWNIGTLVLHSSGMAGGFAVDDGRLDLEKHGKLRGVSPLSPFRVEDLNGPYGKFPVYLPVNGAAQFSAVGILNVGSDFEQHDMEIIDNFTSSDKTVGTVDELGVFIARTPGRTAISCEDYEGSPVDVHVLKVDIAPSETNVHWRTGAAALNLTADSHTGGTAEWSVSPPEGLRVIPSDDDATFTFSPSNSVPGEYVVTAASREVPQCSDSCTVRILDIGIAMDGDRDGEISFDGTNDTSYVFWVNDDCDIEVFNEQMWQEDDLSPTAPNVRLDWNDNHIGNKITPGQGACLRDLEDFARLHIHVDEHTANLPGVTYWLKLDGASGNPSVNIFEAVDETDRYLSDAGIAASQINQTKLVHVSSGGGYYPLGQGTIHKDGSVSCFLLEGCHAGTAALTFVVKKNGEEIGRKAVMLKLHNIAWFYDVWQAKVLSGERWTVDISPTATHSQTAEYKPETEERMLFVHGWNMEEWEKRRWTETIFKRLWWQGYKGSVALFDWPTLQDYDAGIWPPSKWWDLITETRHFDNSEYVSWLSSDALATLMVNLNSDGQLNVLAHSMGNVVTAEALRKYSGPQIKTYIAAQAAISAQYFDGETAFREPAQGFNGADTPDVMGHFGTNGNANAVTYMSGILAAKVRKSNSYHNFDDIALNLWGLNNDLKPDGMPPYHFQYSGSLTDYIEGSDEFYRQSVIHVSPHQTQQLMHETERYRIFAYCAESRSCALGQATNGVIGFTGWDLHSVMEYDNQHYSHSREFRSNVVSEHRLWIQVKSDCE